MCGRMACALCKEDILKASQSYTFKKELPQWVEKHSWQSYSPSYNLSPSQVSPVLIMGDVNRRLKDCNVIVCPMKWGLIPHWYTGLVQDYNVKTSNCRLESILEKPTYKHSLINDQRCVILADGFYEWKTMEKGKKQPYFIHFPQKHGVKMNNRNWESTSSASGTNEWNGPHLLTMAGIFSVWKSSEFGELYSYSIITMDSSKSVSLIHHRMPAILDGNSQVKMWLDTCNVSYEEALANLEAVENLEFYPVSTEVNNSRNNSINCVQPLELKKSNVEGNASPKATFLTSWLKRESHQKQETGQNKKLKPDSLV